ncbi:MAG: regulatory protein RecX [Sphingobacteriia bacterium]|nr:regulatory protein RecX [Sphingobacteriia bacterium]NCC40759.1 regulatory protein RecX [Gammaproteobacteria bacterium]
MVDADPLREVLERARRLLASREHSRLELTRKLRARAYAEPLIVQAIDRLCAEGALDEQRLLERYVDERAVKGYGPLRIRSELGQKGLSDELIEPYLAAMQDDWMAYLADLYDRRFGSEPPADRAEYAKRGRFLEQRGFPTEMIRRFLRRPDE